MRVRPIIAALTFVGILVLAGIIASLACGGGTTPPDVMRCCESATGKVVRTACLAGEVGYPVERCSAPMDASVNSCGDGAFDPATEECDISANRTCQPPKTCSATCKCTDSCGDGMKSPTEQCERNSDCTGAGQVCRQCLCAFASSPVEFDDEVDLPAAEMGAFDIKKLTLTLANPPPDSVAIDVVPGSGQNADPPIALCMVFLEGGAEIARLCLDVTTADRVVHYTDQSGTRVVMPPEVTVGSGVGGGPSLRVAHALLQARVGVSFHIESLRGGRVVDRLPDTGEITYVSILGN